MSRRGCPRGCPNEAELTAAVLAGAWPLGCDPELRAHVAGCSSCLEVVLVSDALRRANLPGAPSASAGALWWRARLRRQHHDAERVAQPMAVAEAAGMGVFLIVAIVLLGANRGPLAQWMRQLFPTPWSAPFVLVLAGSLTALVFAAAAVYHFAGRD